MSLTNNPKNPQKIIKKMANTVNTVEATKTTKVGKQIAGEQHAYVTDLPEKSVMSEKISPSCSVSYSKRQLVNMGNFETVAIEISASIECAEDNLNATYNKVKEFVTGRIELEVDELYMDRDKGSYL